MGASYLPRLVNGPLDDPALFVPFRHEKRALLFDLGDIGALSSRDILKISHIFVTHTHMDHFCGFDRVLRLMLGRDKELYLFGPQGFLANVEGKLAGYRWNLVESYRNRFSLHVAELHPDRALCRSYPCHKGFAPDVDIRELPFDGVFINEPGLTVRAIHLDHGTPVLAFRLDERFRVNVIRTELEKMGLPAGPWLNRLKQMIYEKVNPDTIIEVPGKPKTLLPLRSLKEKIVRISPGQSLAYAADIAGTPTNLDKLAAFAQNVDHLFIEAAFSHKHQETALEKHHLTARQAGETARLCQAKQYSIFHFSPRYSDCPEVLEAEAENAFHDR
jgi:ribonuclease Z